MVRSAHRGQDEEKVMQNIQKIQVVLKGVLKQGWEVTRWGLKHHQHISKGDLPLELMSP